MCRHCPRWIDGCIFSATMNSSQGFGAEEHIWNYKNSCLPEQTPEEFTDMTMAGNSSLKGGTEKGRRNYNQEVAIMKGKRAKSTGALLLGLAVLFGALTAGSGRAYGATAIDTQKKDCKITFTLDVDVLAEAGELTGLEAAVPGYEQYYGELAEYLKGREEGAEPGASGEETASGAPGEGDAPGTSGEGTAPGTSGEDTAPGMPEEGNGPAGNAIQVKLYRIAEVNAGGAYVLLSDYKAVDGLKGVEQADSTTTAGQWLEWAKAAAERAVGTRQEDGTLQPPAAGALEPDESARITLTEGKAQGTAEGLATGLYLVWVEPVDTDYYRYRFVPYLISLPNNYSNPEDGDSSDQWIYGDNPDHPVYVGLKPEREDRYGDLVIEKKLTSYNETLKGASFVFEIKAVKDDRLVYSDVVSLTFDGPGTKQVEITHIPAGADVTVTEIYSGAGYAPADGAAVKTTVIRAESGDAKVTFENEYDGKLNGGGTSVVNHFTYEKDDNGSEALNWEKLESSAGPETEGSGGTRGENGIDAGVGTSENQTGGSIEDSDDSAAGNR